MDQPAQNGSVESKRASLSRLASLSSGQFFRLLVFSTVIILLVVVFFGFLNKNSKPLNSLSVEKQQKGQSDSSPSPKPVILSSFNGKVKSIDLENKTLTVIKADGKIFNAILVVNGVVSAGAKKITFAEIIVGDPVSLYSKNDMPEDGKIYQADLIEIFKPE